VGACEYNMDVFNTVLQTSVQSGVALTVGPLVDSLFPDFDSARHTNDDVAGMALTALEIGAQITAVITVGDLLANALIPDDFPDSLNGTVYQFMLFTLQPNLQVKVSTLSARIQSRVNSVLGKLKGPTGEAAANASE